MKKVPDWNQTRRDRAGKPVVHVMIISGVAKSEVEGWAKETKCEWPILVDERRETEKYFGTQISLKNILQTYAFRADGTLDRTTRTTEDLMQEAKFFFDGITVPAKLKPLADDIELGFFENGVPEIASLAQKGSKELGEAAKAMFEKLKGVADGLVSKAKAFDGEGKKYAAYAEYAKVAAWFKKTDYEKPATAAMAELKKDKGVQDELAAKQLLEQARPLLASNKKSDKPAAAGILAAVQKKYPNTEAAKEAARLAESAK